MLIEDLGPGFSNIGGGGMGPFTPETGQEDSAPPQYIMPGQPLTGGVSSWDPRIQGAIRTAMRGGVDYSVPGFVIQKVFGDPTTIPASVTILGGYPNITGTIQMIPTGWTPREPIPDFSGGYQLPPGYISGGVPGYGNNYPPGGGGGFPPGGNMQPPPTQPVQAQQSRVTINNPAPDTTRPAAATMLGALMQMPNFRPPNYPQYPSVNPAPMQAPTGYHSPGLMR